MLGQPSPRFPVEAWLPFRDPYSVVSGVNYANSDPVLLSFVASLLIALGPESDIFLTGPCAARGACSRIRLRGGRGGGRTVAARSGSLIG